MNVRLPLGFALALLSPAALAQSGPVLHEFDGTHLFQAFGGALAGCADVDGDGVRDVIAGCQQYGFGGGMVRVFSGVTGAVLHEWTGFPAAHSVADAGDVDADGVTDILVGDIWANATFPNAGAAWVFSGATGAQLYRFDGEAPEAYLGGSVAGLGDVDGDGHSDVLIGSWGAPTTKAFAGKAYVRSGLDGSILHELSGTIDHGYFGFSAARIDDTDGDGVADFAVGAEGEDTLGYSTGAVYLYSGATGALLHHWTGFEENSRFGRQVRGAGDADGDGFGDLIVAAMFSVPNGKAYLISGATYAVLHEFEGYDPGEVFAHGVDGAGDVDGDGFDDVIVSSDHYSVPGGYTGFAYVYSGKTGEKLQFLQEGSPTSRFGNATAGVGDVDGDGTPDLAVGAIDQQTPAGGSKSGRVFLFSGVSTGLLFDVQDFHAGATSTFRVAGLAPTSSAGFAFSLAGEGPIPTAFGTLALTPPIYTLGVAASDAGGEAILLAPLPATVAGATVYAQAIEIDAGGGLALTHGQALMVH